MTSQQYILDFPVLQSHSTEDFVIGGCNRLAAETVGRWPDWPSHAIILVGEAASGKTHLAKILADNTGASLMRANRLREAMVPQLSGVVILEDADQGVDEKALFHLFNWTRDHKGFLLLTAKTAPKDWRLTLNDLASRLKSVPVLTLEKPGEDILGAAMAKQFSDRQIMVDKRVMEYLLKRIERSFEAVRQVVGHIDSLSLREKSRVTIPLARKILEARGGEGRGE